MVTFAERNVKHSGRGRTSLESGADKIKTREEDEEMASVLHLAGKQNQLNREGEKRLNL